MQLSDNFVDIFPLHIEVPGELARTEGVVSESSGFSSQRWLFWLKQLEQKQQLVKFMRLIKDYTSRHLTEPADALIAIMGLLQAWRKSTKLPAYFFRGFVIQRERSSTPPGEHIREIAPEVALTSAMGWAHVPNSNETIDPMHDGTSFQREQVPMECLVHSEKFFSAGSTPPLFEGESVRQYPNEKN
jgi:hypothetical protein